MQSAHIDLHRVISGAGKAPCWDEVICFFWSISSDIQEVSDSILHIEQY